MPSVVGLLEQHELAARRRVDELREEADRVQAELATVEQEWQEWVIARRRVDTVLAPNDGSTARAEATADPRNADAPPAARDAAKPKTQVPVWRQGLPGRCCLPEARERYLRMAVEQRVEAPLRALQAAIKGQGINTVHSALNVKSEIPALAAAAGGAGVLAGHPLLGGAVGAALTFGSFAPHTSSRPKP